MHTFRRWRARRGQMLESRRGALAAHRKDPLIFDERDVDGALGAAQVAALAAATVVAAAATTTTTRRPRPRRRGVVLRPPHTLLIRVV